MPQEESVLLDINERFGPAEPQANRRAVSMRLVGGAAVLALVAAACVVGLTSQAGQRTELAESVAHKLGYSLDRKTPLFSQLEEEEAADKEEGGDAEAIVAPVPAIAAVAGAHAASRGAAGEANALESQIGDLKKEIHAIANTKELEAKLQAKIAQDRRWAEKKAEQAQLRIQNGVVDAEGSAAGRVGWAAVVVGNLCSSGTISEHYSRPDIAVLSSQFELRRKDCRAPR